MGIQMSFLPVDRILFDSRLPDDNGNFEFILDNGAVYFGTVYDGDGSLLTIDQYFFSRDFCREKMESAIDNRELLQIDISDFPVKTYMLNKNIDGTEWLRFHAVVPSQIDPDYYYQKYIGE